MKLQALTALLFSTATLRGTCAQSHVRHHRQHRSQHDAMVARGGQPPVASLANRQAGNPAGSSSKPPAPTPQGSGSGGIAATPRPTPVAPGGTGTNGVPPLNAISSGMPAGTPLPVPTNYAPGAIPPVPGAPPLPAPCSSEVQQWMQELTGVYIPPLSPTVNGTCAGDPAAAAEATARGWWTCSWITRDTDITTCPTPLDWGVSFDDGPSPWSEKLLNYMGSQDLKATFFVVGSRVIERPNVLVEEYMTGNEISVHTWSHHPLTSLTNEQIVAELGWTRKVIQTVLGVTPTTMRPPYGDIDDRVRAISLAMGMVPVIWTSTPASGPFDTNDWKVAGGLLNGAASYNAFEAILGNATSLSTGFIVLEHDLFEVTVDLAIGYTLNAALAHDPPFSLKPIGNCSNIPVGNMYVETNTNITFPYRNNTVVTTTNTTTSSRGSDSGSGSGSASQLHSNSATGRRKSLPWVVAGLIGGYVVVDSLT
ncbi:chitin deacetylase [Russula earlei]|uniref:Chitin deacetylase n=1 Tax=Russula earlei TaxID=71964 RepID=A0ACC0UG66_9AGAM|nr:chitin deacetylase [Russula earlei]